MFSLLTPAVLWLAPLLAVPLAIHFLGRAEPKPQDFPTLLPVRASLQRAMRRHRVKNWLLLILRTLALLCLLLAAAAPVWRRGDAWQPPATAGLLLHNGAYARATLPAASRSFQGFQNSGNSGTVRERQQFLRAGLDSLTAGHVIVESLLPETGNSSAPQSARFGRPAEAMARLLRSLDPESAAHAFIPVFNARDLNDLVLVARPWLENHPRARLVIVDYAGGNGSAPALQAFDDLRASTRTETGSEGVLVLKARTKAGQAPIWVPRENPGSGFTRTATLRDGMAEVALPLSSLPRGGWIAGEFTPADADPAREAFAFPATAVAYRIPPPATLCHLGGGVGPAGRGNRGTLRGTSLATLGEGGRRLRIVPLSAGSRLEEHSCDLLYLADPRDLNAGVLAHAAAVVRTGGKLILETGSRTDPALWNRNLLVPLGVGRLTGILPAPGDGEDNAGRIGNVQSVHGAQSVHSRTSALAALGMRADRWGAPGSVTTRFGFLPAAGTRVLLSTAAGGDRNGGTNKDAHDASPLLVHRSIGNGELLLWTTSLDDPAWSNIGLGPWAALLHQAFLEKAWAAGIGARNTDADSIVFLPLRVGTHLRMIDPAGNAFDRVRQEPGGWSAGPFERPGLYRLEFEADRAGDSLPAAWLAVRPATPPPPPSAADWERFHAELGEQAGSQAVRLQAGDEWRSLYGGTRLRLGLLILTALLLFAEGAVSLRLSPFRDENTRAS